MNQSLDADHSNDIAILDIKPSVSDNKCNSLGQIDDAFCANMANCWLYITISSAQTSQHVYGTIGEATPPIHAVIIVWTDPGAAAAKITACKRVKAACIKNRQVESMLRASCCTRTSCP